MPTTTPPRLLYTLDRHRAYHFVTFILAVLAVVLVWLGALLPPENMRAEFGSIAGGRLAQAALIGAGAGPLLAWLWWMRRYVARITWLPDTREVEVVRCGYLVRKTRRLTPSAFLKVSAHAGHSELPGTPVVNAPYRRLIVQGLPPLILDDQGTVHDQAALDAILGGRSPDAAPAAPRRR